MKELGLRGEQVKIFKCGGCRGAQLLMACRVYARHFFLTPGSIIPDKSLLLERTERKVLIFPGGLYAGWNTNHSHQLPTASPL